MTAAAWAVGPPSSDDCSGAIAIEVPSGGSGMGTGGCCQCFGSVQFCTIESEGFCATLGGTWLGEGTGCTPIGAVTASSSPGIPIPDNDPAGVSDTIVVGESLTVNAISVEVRIDHTWIGDLCVSLSKDGGTPELLMSRINEDTGGNVCHQGAPFGCSLNNLDVTFDQAAGESIEFQCATDLTGFYLPSPGSLAPFTGIDSAGSWTLNVSDNAAADTGTIVSWTLKLSHGSGLTTCSKTIGNQCGGFCPWDCGNFNNVVDTADFLALIGTWGQAGVPCDFGVGPVGVDTAEFLELLGHWGPCQAPEAGPCCQANGSIGCDDVACERAVCAIDPFCCDSEWDGICANEAIEDLLHCACTCGAEPAGSCCNANGTPFCNDEACCDAVCVIDPKCCDIEWDSVCAEEAAKVPLCGCPGP